MRPRNVNDLDLFYHHGLRCHIVNTASTADGHFSPGILCDDKSKNPRNINYLQQNIKSIRIQTVEKMTLHFNPILFYCVSLMLKVTFFSNTAKLEILA